MSSDPELGTEVDHRASYALNRWFSTRGLHKEDIFTIQLTCASAQAKTGAGYYNCLDRYVSEVQSGAAYPAEKLAGHANMETMERACVAVRLDGPAIYDGCIENQLKAPRLQFSYSG